MDDGAEVDSSNWYMPQLALGCLFTTKLEIVRATSYQCGLLHSFSTTVKKIGAGALAQLGYGLL